MQKNISQVVRRWPTEILLFSLVLIISLVAWVVIAYSIWGLVYVTLVGLMELFLHAVAIAHIRGNAVKVDDEQFPELYSSVTKICKSFNITKVPDVYLMQAGGVLNALATKFAFTRMVVVYSHLLEACEGDEAARDMIIGHELGHIKAGHLRWSFLLAPGMYFPFLGKAYSRAREYTCDRYGLVAAQSKEGAIRGLTILATGKHYASCVNHSVLVKQLKQLNTGWMKIGSWLSTHPLLVKRLCAIDPSLQKNVNTSYWGSIKGVSIILAFFVIPLAALFIATSTQQFADLKHEIASQAASDKQHLEESNTNKTG